MIEFKKFRIVDIILIIILAVAWIFLNYYELDFLLLVFITTLFVLFIALLIRKICAVMLFFLTGLILTYILSMLDFVSEYVLIFFICGIIFELIAYFVEERYYLLILDAGFSMALFPFIALFMTGIRTKELFMLTLNLSLLCFLTGIVAAILGILIWLRIRGIKKVIEFVNEC